VSFDTLSSAQASSSRSEFGDSSWRTARSASRITIVDEVFSLYDQVAQEWRLALVDLAARR
jgi:hypothetical protein